MLWTKPKYTFYAQYLFFYASHADNELTWVDAVDTVRPQTKI